jgi:hypothetical protein
VRLVSQPIGALLRGRSVIAQAVGLHNQAELGPIEVDPVAVDHALRLGLRQTSPAHDRQKAAL